MSNLPDFLRDQLPDAIKKIVDHPEHSSLADYVEGFTHMAQYTYPVMTRNGQPSDTTLATVVGMEQIRPEAGQEVCLFGVWVRVASVSTTTGVSEEDDRPITFCTAVVEAPGGGCST